MKNGKKAAARTSVMLASRRKQSQMRMYNVGFGDSFLLKVPTDNRLRRVLVDCGFHTQGKAKFSDKELVAQIKADLGGEPLDVVIATHRHQDHISGFGETELWAGIGLTRSGCRSPLTLKQSTMNRLWRHGMAVGTS